MTSTSLTNLRHLPGAAGPATTPIRVNVPAHGTSQGYLLALELAPVAGPYGLPGMPHLTYSGQGGSARKRASVGRLSTQFPGVCRAAETWDVQLRSTDLRDIADVVSVMEMALAQGLSTSSFAANVDMTAPEARLGLLQRHVVTEAQLEAAEADARRQARAWVARTHVALPAQQQGAQHAATLGIAGLRALSGLIGGPVAAPYRRTADPCTALPPDAYRSARTLAGFATIQAWATLPGLMPVRFPGRTLFDSVARTVRKRRRMPSGQGAEVCRQHGWIWVNGPLMAPVANAAVDR